MKGFNPNWPMWVNDSTFGRRHPPASSSATASAGTWIGSRNPTSSWENSQSSEIGSNQNLDYNRLGSPSHSLSSPLGPNSRHVRVASRIVGEDGNLNATISTDTDDRSVITVKPLHPTQRYEAQTMTHPSLNTITAYGNGPTPAGIDDLTMGLRGMVVDEDQGVSAIPQGALFRQHGPPSMAMHPGIHIRQPISQPQQRPYSLYPSQGDYTTYYTGPALPDYPFNYDYRANADPAVYASPIMANNIASGHLYPITQAVQASSQTSAEIHRQAHGMIYDYSGAAPAHPSGSYYYTTHPPVLFHPQEVSHSPTLQVLGGIPATMGVKKQRYDHFHLNTQQNLLMQSVRHPTPPSHSYNALLQYMSSPPVMMPGNPVFGQPQINSSSMTLYSQHTRPSRRGHHLETGVVLRSPVLEEFRTNKARKWEIQEILGHVTEFSGDQHGSRFLQQKLETASMDERQSVFDEIVPVNALRLIMDVFGNYVIQKLFEYGTQLQRSALIDSMEGHILPLSLQMYGCRVVQKAIECALPEQQTIFVKELDPHVHRCVRDANGNHVIQKLIERVPAERLPFIHMFKSCIYELSTHPYGCRVLQRCFEHLDEDRARPLLDEVHKYAINLMQDQFGNYVMQFILENGKPLDTALVISKLRGQLLNMARHKFASNVCEKALTTADDKSRRILIDEILTPRQDGVSPIVTMMKDQFANYVLQRALAVAEGEQKELLTSKIKQQLQTMRRYSSVYSKHLASIERTLEKSSNQKESDSQTITLENISKISASTD